jgi:hypothetical protein
MCGSRDLMHKHHIIPRYMGGSNAPENLVEVTVTQHAMFHFCNFQLWGNMEDSIAWRALAGIIDKEQIVYEKVLLGVEAARTPEVLQRKKEKFKQIGHQQGKKNSQYGKVWITNGTAEGSYRIGKDEPIPEGYHKGRVCDNKLTGIYTIIAPTGQIYETDNLGEYGIEHNLIPEEIKKVLSGKRDSHKNYRFLKGPISAQDPSNLISVEKYKQKKLEDNVQYYTELYRIYREAGSFNGFCGITGYDKSLPALCFGFRKYVESYEPQSKNQHTQQFHTKPRESRIFIDFFQDFRAPFLKHI